jgi:primosomal protein N' (replication factor Y)
VSFARQHDFLGFFQDEILRRQTMLYPPYTRLARLLLDGAHVEQVQAASQWLESVLRPQLSEGQLALLGPAEAPIAKIQDRYRWHLLLKSPSSRLLHQCLRTVLTEVAQARQHWRGIRLSLDIDPLTFM